MSRKLKNHEKKELGIRLKHARKEAGLSQKEIATHLSVSDKAISSYEIGRTTPSYSLLKKISTIVHKPLSYFDETISEEDSTLESKIALIERELLEVKKLLQKRNK